MNPTHRTRALFGAVALALSAIVPLACGEKARQHASDGDTGAAAPATVRDMSATPQVPDSNSGMSRPTGQPAAAGDTLGAKPKAKKP
jgi:hypothetical protein